MEIRAGLDWFSASRADGPGAWEWCLNGIHALNTIAEEGNEVRAGTLQGYAGIWVGGSFCGSRHDGYFVQVSGKHADEWFSTLYDSECSVTRIDLQVTVQYDEYDHTIGGQCYDDSERYALSLPEARRWKQSTVTSSDGGYTVYIGAAGAKARACIYNKDREARTDDYARCWRYEVRYRGEMADKWSEHLSSSTRPREYEVLEQVRAWLINRGIYRSELGDLGDAALPRLSARKTDVDRKLAWLKTQVAPSIAYLQTRVERSIILLALGLAE